MTTITYENPLLPPPQLVLPDINETMSSIKRPSDNDRFLDMPYIPVPYAIENVANFELNNLATARDIATLQDKANKNAENLYKQSTLKGLTLRNGVEDMREALTGIWTDLYKNDLEVPVNIFTKNNRLRGLGLFFILFTFAYFMFIAFS